MYKMTMSTHDLNKNRTPSVAFLIDADNLSPGGVEDAFEHLLQAGATVQVRRAYGGIEKLAGMKDVLRRYAIQGVVNLGKGTTDVALVVDAMDMLHRAALPGTVAIGSSDADFAPLVARLREAGMLVICFAQKLISSDALAIAYDRVIFVDSKLAVKPPQTESLKTRLAIVPLQSGSKLDAAPNAGSSVTPTLKKSPNEGVLIANASVAAFTTAAAEDELAEVRRILVALPEWLPNTIKQLNQLGGPLRVGGIKKGSRPLHDLFRKYPAYFKVLPSSGPAKQVRLLKRP